MKNESLYNMKNIELFNYRCFDQSLFVFSDKVNLLIGDNSSGKTTIIRAVSSAMSSFFTGFSDENTRFIGLSKDDFKITESETGLVNEAPIKVDFLFLGRVASLELRSHKARTLLTPLKPIAELGKDYMNGLFINNRQVMELPLMCSYSTADIHYPRRFSDKLFLRYKHKPSFGYFECLQGDGFLKYWTKRLLVLREGRASELEVQGVTNALIEALGDKGCGFLKSLDIRPIQGKIYYELLDGRFTDTENLSDGLKRLVNIVMDMSFRCMLLNQGIFGLEACRQTKGTVLIDEVDLHLHPTLQSVVMKGLQQAFPNVQFIITSHAPMIMTGIPIDDENKIIKLGYNVKDGYSAKEIETYGMDASTIIQAVLGVTPRSQDVQDRLKTLFAFIDNDQYDNAILKLKEMRTQFGNYLPELAKAEAMLNFLTDKSNDSNL